MNHFLLTIQLLIDKYRINVGFMVCFIVGVSFFYEYFYIGIAIFTIFSSFMIKPIIPDLIKTVKNTYVIKFYNICIWLSAYVISLKLLSYQTGIPEENLKYSPALIAIPLSLILALIIFLFISLVATFIIIFASYFSPIVKESFKRKISSSRLYLISTRLFYTIPFTFILIFIIAHTYKPILRLALLADSSFISSCGDKKKDKMYLRIDSESCLVSTLDINLLTSEPKIISSEEQ